MSLLGVGYILQGNCCLLEHFHCFVASGFDSIQTSLCCVHCDRNECHRDLLMPFGLLVDAFFAGVQISWMTKCAVAPNICGSHVTCFM